MGQNQNPRRIDPKKALDLHLADLRSNNDSRRPTQHGSIRILPMLPIASSGDLGEPWLKAMLQIPHNHHVWRFQDLPGRAQLPNKVDFPRPQLARRVSEPPPLPDREQPLPRLRAVASAVSPPYQDGRTERRNEMIGRRRSEAFEHLVLKRMAATRGRIGLAEQHTYSHGYCGLRLATSRICQVSGVNVSSAEYPAKCLTTSNRQPSSRSIISGNEKNLLTWLSVAIS